MNVTSHLFCNYYPGNKKTGVKAPHWTSDCDFSPASVQCLGLFVGDLARLLCDYYMVSHDSLGVLFYIKSGENDRCSTFMFNVQSLFCNLNRTLACPCLPVYGREDPPSPSPVPLKVSPTAQSSRAFGGDSSPRWGSP